MKTRTLLASALVLLAGIAIAPTAAAEKDICSEPANSTIEYACIVRDATVGYANEWKDAALALEDCLVNQQPIGKWFTVCIPLT
jgi:hypothetical protein